MAVVDRTKTAISTLERSPFLRYQDATFCFIKYYWRIPITGSGRNGPPYNLLFFVLPPDLVFEPDRRFFYAVEEGLNQ
ncbi:hypothetical protein SAMN05444359_101366 [Neolewinella agarilytica]|uniref:Uncharacterized protein n=1 Tax=Neolewinella agarilytica TaxID=478744 RepID=A0A1H8ZLC6_9BACT|nr:hypothetical protein SAMN05444359_101366 [Neolewinella agarilytica]